MNDDLDQILGTEPAEPADPGAVATTDDADKITLSKAEIDRLKEEAAMSRAAADDARRAVEDLQAQIARNQAPAAPTPQQQLEFDWNDPTKTIAKLTEDKIREIASPYIRNVTQNSANMAIMSFKSEKAGHPFYGPAIEIFNREVAGLNKEWLGSLSPDDLHSTLEKAWAVAVGLYVEAERSKRPAKTPPNLGGSGGSGGGASSAGAKRSLAELDPIAYRWAKENGLSEEDMADIARDLEG